MDMYRELGVRPIIDAWGTVTKLGGSRMDPRVLEAMNSAAKSFVDMEELHTAAGKKIAEMLQVEACCVTCGASAGLAIAAAACMTGNRKSFAYQLPDTTGMKDEVLVLKCHRDLYDQALLLSGAHFVEIGMTSHAFLQQIEDKISDRTAAFFFTSEAETMRGSIPLEEIAELCSKYNVPIIVDAAAELPPVSNVRKYLEQGASLVVFSGGKEIRGPQASGLIVGKKELIEACDLNCCPNYGIGRPMKVDKENICGLVKAVELFVNKDYDKQMELWESYTHRMHDGLKDNPNLELSLGYPTEPGVQPACILRLFVKPLTMDSATFYQKLVDHDPGVYTFLYQDKVVINPQCLEEDELQIVIDAFNDVAV
ncbi:MAG: aminotransferase class V-fold PLP-dependent enzyme [Firmicutes bacterium]|nr:aminotransferase class V-fold PLP-dependent enzyme [Bacillota bacterium]